MITLSKVALDVLDRMEGKLCSCDAGVRTLPPRNGVATTQNGHFMNSVVM